MCENCLGNVEKSVTENMAKGVPQTGVFSVYQYSDVMMGAMTSLYIYMRRSKKTSKFRVTGLCAGNSPGTGEFPA